MLVPGCICVCCLYRWKRYVWGVMNWNAVEEGRHRVCLCVYLRDQGQARRGGMHSGIGGSSSGAPFSGVYPPPPFPRPCPPSTIRWTRSATAAGAKLSVEARRGSGMPLLSCCWCSTVVGGLLLQRVAPAGVLVALCFRVGETPRLGESLCCCVVCA